MKILWFTNTACSATEKLGIIGQRGGWLKSLEEEISFLHDIELSICFYVARKHEPFVLKRTAYYPVARRNTHSKTARLANRIFGNEGDDELEIKELISVIEVVKPDLIHIHGTEENFGLLQQWISVPVVISIQGILSPYIEKFFSGIPRNTASRYEGIVKKLSFGSAAYLQNKLSIRAEREKKILQKTRYVIGRTDWDRRVTRILSPRSSYFYNNEILRSSFYGISWNKNGFNAMKRIVTISSGALPKGFETIVKTANVLVSYPGFLFEWLVIGLDKESAIVKTVQRWLKADFSKLNIVFTGSKSEEDIVELLSGSDIYCQVSHMENSPNSLCEAMLIGMPVVASYAGGTGSLLEDGKEGILVQDGDPFSLAGAIMELSLNFQVAAAYGCGARRKALGRHDKNKIVADLAEIYNVIVREGE